MNFASVYVDQIEMFLLVFVRILSIIALMPFFGSQSIPFQLKTGLAGTLAIILFPAILAHSVPLAPVGLVPFVYLVFQQVFVGILIGYVTSFLFTAIQYSGRLIDTQMGFAFAEINDPFTEEPVTVLGQLYILIFSIFFLLLNGHYVFLLAIQKTFEVIPLAGVKMPDAAMVSFLTTVISGIFVSALKLSAPVFVTLFLTTIAMGVIARTVPQINVFFIGVPLSIILGMITTIIAFPYIAGVFRKMTDALMLDVWKLIYLMA